MRQMFQSATGQRDHSADAKVWPRKIWGHMCRGIYICLLTMQRSFSPQQTPKDFSSERESELYLKCKSALMWTSYYHQILKKCEKKAAGDTKVFLLSLCLCRGMLGDKSSPKEVGNQRKIHCWGSACLVRKLRNISSLCSLVAFQVWRLSTRCRRSGQEASGCLLRHAFRLFAAQTPAWLMAWLMPELAAVQTAQLCSAPAQRPCTPF